MRANHKVMLASVKALVIRNIQGKFIVSVNTKRISGLFWLVFEPLLHVAILSSVRLYYGVEVVGMHTALFVVLGILPFIFARNIITFSATAIKKHKRFYNFRQILPIDIILAHWITEIFILIIIATIVFLMMYGYGINFYLYHPIKAMLFIGSYLVFSLGLSLVISLLGYYFFIVIPSTRIITRALYFFSGIFFPASSIPIELRPYFLLNPLFQVTEGLREAFIPVEVMNNHSDLSYLLHLSVCTLFLGVLGYYMRRNHIMTTIQEL